jgi:hypothetical protein
MKLEQAFDQDSHFVGWRITAHHQTLLVFDNPDGLEGFRVGEGFNADYSGSISYKDVTPAIEH